MTGMLAKITIALFMMSDISLFLFRNDLRLKDNAALTAAVSAGDAVVPVYIFDEDDDHWSMGSASRWWLYHSLSALSAEIERLGGQLFLRKGNTLDVLQQIVDEAGVSRLFFSRSYEPRQRKIEDAIYERWCKRLEVKRYGGYLLFEPEQVLTGQGQAYKVFTPFWKACLSKQVPQPGKQHNFKATDFCQKKIETEQLDHWQLLPARPDWAAGFREHWQPGEHGAMQALNEFIETALTNYEEDRNRPDRSGTSRLSPHLHFGEIAPVRVWHDIRQASAGDKLMAEQGMSYLRELGWRDFANHLLYKWPNLPDQPFRTEFSDFPWQQDNPGLRAWQQGETGYPIVDAGMRQLWHSGWMHNRVRMIVGSFLVKHLLIHWREGESWFWDTLVDADLANNAAGWQWVAGSGADAAPYFRVFNPILQGKKFDPDGDYVRHWVPELAKLSRRYIHEPWQADPQTLAAAGIELGKNYPQPLIDHGLGRKRALDAFASFKNRH